MQCTPNTNSLKFPIINHKRVVSVTSGNQGQAMMHPRTSVPSLYLPALSFFPTYPPYIFLFAFLFVCYYVHPVLLLEKCYAHMSHCSPLYLIISSLWFPTLLCSLVCCFYIFCTFHMSFCITQCFRVAYPSLLMYPTYPLHPKVPLYLPYIPYVPYVPLYVSSGPDNPLHFPLCPPLH